MKLFREIFSCAQKVSLALWCGLMQDAEQRSHTTLCRKTKYGGQDEHGS